MIIIISEDPYIHLMKPDSRIRELVMPTHSAYIMNRKVLSYSQLRSVASVMRIHFLHVIKRKPHLHDGTVMTKPDKNKLVDIPPRSSEPPDGRMDIDSVSTSNATTSSKKNAKCTFFGHYPASISVRSI